MSAIKTQNSCWNCLPEEKHFLHLKEKSRGWRPEKYHPVHQPVPGKAKKEEEATFSFVSPE
ncbi:hypothetical protein PPQ61_004119 [Salmonella enterica]|nr:hypothetical protein [Salmonella enterica]EEU6565067.1 hypothetical protein [Salmonella enterica]EEU8132632.1 hypothetical protein [Salmonella enterica]EFQ4614324.1 hypothetical protein [Salmonella enterica]EFS1793264.1 hypothetical protein [Salmonella enterica]